MKKFVNNAEKLNEEIKSYKEIPFASFSKQMCWPRTHQSQVHVRGEGINIFIQSNNNYGLVSAFMPDHI